MSDYAIEVKNISKTFSLPHEKHSSIKGAFVNIFRLKKRTIEKQTVLKDINLSIKKGEFFGVVGRNGCGKSTLLKLLAGVYSPDKGSISINGTLTPFIELGVGFNFELTGRENVFLNGALLGFSRKEMEKMYDDIVEFAELHKFMDQKLKNYSSGMQVRLAFSIAIKSKSSILLFDEVLAVGDTNFQKKCFDIFRQIKEEGRTVVLVTHDMGSVEKFCDRAMLLKDGKIDIIANSSDVAKRYNLHNLEASIIQERKVKKEENIMKRTAIKPVQILNVEMTDDKNKKKTGHYSPDQKINMIVTCKFKDDVDNPIIGITIKDQNGQRLFDTNTHVAKIKTGLCKKGQVSKVRISLQNVLSDGVYIVDSAVANTNASLFYAIENKMAVFTTGGWDFPSAVVQPMQKVEYSVDKKEENNV